MRSLLLAVAAGTLCLSTISEAAVIMDYGTDAGQSNTGTGIQVWGGFGGGTKTRTWNADSFTVSYTTTGQWTTMGEQYRGGAWNAASFAGVQPATDKLALQARFIVGSPAPDYFIYRMTLLAVDGSSSTYNFIDSVRANPTPFSYGTDTSTPFTVAMATTTIGSPVSVGGGGFDFTLDTLAGIDVVLQNGLNPGTVSVEIDNIQIVPEPTALGLIGAGATLLLRRRHRA